MAIDVGCGTGQNTYLYADFFKRVIGTDVSPSQIAEANKGNSMELIALHVCERANERPSMCH